MLRSIATLVVGLAVCFPGQAAERVKEIWRSRYGQTYYTFSQTSGVANPNDGSLWLPEGATVTRLSPAGELLARSPALGAPGKLAIDPANGSCWVLEGVSGRLAHLWRDGRLLSTTPGFSPYGSLIPSPADGSVWVTGQLLDDYGAPYDFLAHVSATGQELSRGAGRWQVVVDPNDGTLWKCSETEIVCVSPDGSEAWRIANPGGTPLDTPGEDPRDHSLWLVSPAGKTTHLSADGDLVWQGSTDARLVRELWVSPLDSSVWISYYTPLGRSTTDALATVAPPELVHLNSSGAEVWRLSNANPMGHRDLDGSIWVAAYDAVQGWGLIQYSAEGQELRRFSRPDSTLLTYSQSDNSFWGVLATGNLTHLGPDGAIVWQEHMPHLDLAGRGVDPQDGSVWATDGADLVRLSPAGIEMERRPIPSAGEGYYFSRLTVSPWDDSWWLTYTDYGGSGPAPLLLHLAADGTELSRHDKIGWEPVVSQFDGSVWGQWTDYTWWSDGEVLHEEWHAYVRRLSPDGVLLWTHEYLLPVSDPWVDDTDGSVWIGVDYPEGVKLEHFSAAGEFLGDLPIPDVFSRFGEFAVSPLDGSVYATGVWVDEDTLEFEGWAGRMSSSGGVLWQHGGFYAPENMALDLADGSLWVSDMGEWGTYFSPGSVVAHFAADGEELWRSQAFNGPGWLALDSRDGSVWVSDWMNDQIVHLAVVQPPFPDVPGDFWACDEIIACVYAGIVEGYPDGGYHPAAPVTRDQMAVYISRALAGGDANVPTGPATATFPDVPTEHWAFQYVEYCKSLGIVQGYWDGYHPDEAVDRAQMAVFVARSTCDPIGEDGLNSYVAPSSATFPDVPTDFWAYKHVEYIAAEGVTQGYPDGFYHPEYVCTRDQMAVYVQRAFDLPT